jgi:hypothetical protein
VYFCRHWSDTPTLTQWLVFSKCHCVSDCHPHAQGSFAVASQGEDEQLREVW